MPEQSKALIQTDLRSLNAARMAARKRFKHLHDDDGAAVDAVDPENQPLTEDQLAQLRPSHEIHPKLVAASLRRRSGRPKLAAAKRVVSIRLDPDLIDALRAEGAGWQTRINELLRKAMGLNT